MWIFFKKISDVQILYKKLRISRNQMSVDTVNFGTFLINWQWMSRDFTMVGLLSVFTCSKSTVETLEKCVKSENPSTAKSILATWVGPALKPNRKYGFFQEWISCH